MNTYFEVTTTVIYLCRNPKKTIEFSGISNKIKANETPQTTAERVHEDVIVVRIYCSSIGQAFSYIKTRQEESEREAKGQEENPPKIEGSKRVKK
jgi:hypothetical protein